MDRATTVALLGLIWATWQIWQVSRRKLSSKHEKLSYFIGYMVGWAVLVELIFVSQIPSPTNEYLIVGLSVLFVIALTWAYLGERISKSARIPPLLQGTKVLLVITFVVACLTEAFSMYLLYESSYLWGSYDVLSLLAKTVGHPMHEALPTIYRAIASSVVGVAVSTISIAFAMYSQGVLRERKRKSFPTHPAL